MWYAKVFLTCPMDLVANCKFVICIYVKVSPASYEGQTYMAYLWEIGGSIALSTAKHSIVLFCYRLSHPFLWSRFYKQRWQLLNTIFAGVCGITGLLLGCYPAGTWLRFDVDATSSRCIEVTATSSRHIDLTTTSFRHCVSTGYCRSETCGSPIFCVYFSVPALQMYAIGCWYLQSTELQLAFVHQWIAIIPYRFCCFNKHFIWSISNVDLQPT